MRVIPCAYPVRLRAEITRSGRRLLRVTRTDYREDEPANCLDFGSYAIVDTETGSVAANKKEDRRRREERHEDGKRIICARGIGGTFDDTTAIQDSRLARLAKSRFLRIIPPRVQREEAFVVTRGSGLIPISRTFFYSRVRARARSREVKLISFTVGVFHERACCCFSTRWPQELFVFYGICDSLNPDECWRTVKSQLNPFYANIISSTVLFSWHLWRSHRLCQANACR